MAWICFPHTAKSFPCHKITSESQGKIRSSGKTLVGKQWREVLVTAGCGTPTTLRCPQGPPPLPSPSCSPSSAQDRQKPSASSTLSTPLSFPRLKQQRGLEHLSSPLLCSRLGWQQGQA